MRKYSFIIGLFSCISIFIILLIYVPLGNKLELTIYDLYINSIAKDPDPQIVIVDVDDYSINQASDKSSEGLGRYPWPRTTFTKIMSIITRGKPKAIVLDVNFEGKTVYKEKEYSDKEFIEQLKSIPDVFILQKTNLPGYNFNKELNNILEKQKFNNDKEKVTATSYYISSLYSDGPINLLKPHYYNVIDHTTNNEHIQSLLHYYKLPRYIDGIYKYAKQIAVSNSFTDNDNTVRSYQPVYKYVDNYLLSTPLAVANFVKGGNNQIVLSEKVLKFGDKTISLNDKMRFFINWRKYADKTSLEHKPFTIYKNRCYKYISFYNLLYYQKYNINPEIFKDKIVVIGNSSDIAKDNVAIP
ncbi:MAG: CHASE2 domain-containing protein, partial [Vampirovibrionia bacterium]